MTLQDIHKEFDKEFNMGINGNRENEFGTIQGFDEASVKDFYDKKIVEILKDSMPKELDRIRNDRDTGYTDCLYEIIENFKARNINLD